MAPACDTRVPALRLSICIWAGALCSAHSSSVIDVVLGPRAAVEQALVGGGPKAAPFARGDAESQSAPQLKRDSNTPSSIVRRQHDLDSSHEASVLQHEVGLVSAVSDEMHVAAARSQAVDHALRRIGDGLDPGTTRDFLRTLRLCVPCKQYKRFGEANNDGYVMCTDALEGGLIAAFSYGIDGHDGWGMAVASRYRIPLHEYDCISAKQPKVCPGCVVRFHDECIMNVQGPMPGPKYKSLAQQLEECAYAQVADRSLLLKIDIDSGAEWKVLAEEPVHFLQKFRQIVVHYHDIDQIQNHQRYLQAGNNLEAAGFGVVHLHGNNMASGLQSFGEYRIPADLEVTYAQKSGRGCSSGLPYHVAEDLPTNADAPELGVAVLPRSLHGAVARPPVRRHTTTLPFEPTAAPAGLPDGDV